MQTVDDEAFFKCIEDLGTTVGIDNSGPHTNFSCLQGVTVLLKINVEEYERSSEEQFLTLVRNRYLSNLRIIVEDVVGEMYEIAKTGKSDNLIRAAGLLKNAFEENDNAE